MQSGLEHLVHVAHAGEIAAHGRELLRRRLAAEQLAAMSRDLASVSDVDQVLQTGLHHVSDVFDSAVILRLPDATGALAIKARYPPRAEDAPGELAVAQWVHEHDQRA